MKFFNDLNRWSGITLMLAGIYIAMFGLDHPIGIILAAIGLAGLHFEQGQEAGKLSLLGLIITIVGSGIYLIVTILVLFPVSASQPLVMIVKSCAFFAGITLVLGYILLGVAEKMAGVYNGNNGIVLAIGAFLTILFGSWGAILLGFGMVWLGYSLYSDNRINQEMIQRSGSIKP